VLAADGRQRIQPRQVIRVTRLAVFLIVVTPLLVHGQRADTVNTRDVAAGVTHARMVRLAGPWIVNVVKVDLRNTELNLRHVRAKDSLLSRERVSDMARRYTSQSEAVVVAINADFFDVASGRSENNQMIDGEWWRGLPVTDSPFDTFDNIHSQFAFDSLRRPLLDRFSFHGLALARNGARLEFLSLNSAPSFTEDSSDAAHLYTRRFGGNTPVDTMSSSTSELLLEEAGRRGDTLLFRRVAAARRSGGSGIPPNGVVLAGYGARAADVALMALSDTLKLLVGVRMAVSQPASQQRQVAPVRTDARKAPLALVVGGWPRILRNGVNVAANSAADEGTIERNAGVRHPRSAVGFSRDSSVLFLVTVDGRSNASVGMTIVELADVMLEFGAWDALNFDGGGSTTMVVDGRVVNSPADAAGERAVGNALLVTRKIREQ
jgi:hypothetical protein